MDFLQRLRYANVERCKDFGHSVEEWSPAEWALAVAGETGELCNLVKKMHRGDAINPGEIADEVADVVIYLDLFSARMGFNLPEIVASKFNFKSDQIGSHVKVNP